MAAASRVLPVSLLAVVLHLSALASEDNSAGCAGTSCAAVVGDAWDGTAMMQLSSHVASADRAVLQQRLPSARGEAPSAAGGGARTLQLVKMEAKAKSTGAVCLDGTPGAFYISEAPAEHRKEGQWMIHLQGGGWCYDEPTCYNRTVFIGGSTALSLPNRTFAELGLAGIMSDNCAENPTFCNFTVVLAIYCDGASFSGNRADPVVYTDATGNKTDMWFRGRRILDAVIDTLVEDYGLGSAKEVLLGGDSAGGLAVFSQANYIQKKLQSKAHNKRPRAKSLKFRLAPNSGFFLYHNNVGNKMVWQGQMQYLYSISNWTMSDNACLDNYVKELQWLCVFPQNTYPFLRPPIFVLNSALDFYQIPNFLAAEPITGFPNWENTEVSIWSGYNASAVPGWDHCSGGEAHIENCTAGQIGQMNEYMDTFVDLLSGAPTFRKKGNGAFIYGCFNHNAEMIDLDYRTYGVGGVAMREALAGWWLAGAEPSRRHTYVERGRYSYPASVKDANPTCNYLCDGRDPAFCKLVLMWGR